MFQDPNDSFVAGRPQTLGAHRPKVPGGANNLVASLKGPHELFSLPNGVDSLEKLFQEAFESFEESSLNKPEVTRFPWETRPKSERDEYFGYLLPALPDFGRLSMIRIMP